MRAGVSAAIEHGVMRHGMVAHSPGRKPGCGPKISCRTLTIPLEVSTVLGSVGSGMLGKELGSGCQCNASRVVTDHFETEEREATSCIPFIDVM
jgi:hypothetical protein